MFFPLKKKPNQKKKLLKQHIGHSNSNPGRTATWVTAQG